MLRRVFLAATLIVAVAVLALWFFREPTEPPRVIQVRSTDILVQNQTSQAWSNIEVWVNDRYRGVMTSLSPGQVLAVPLDNLVAAYGQRFDVHRQAVYGVLVTARVPGGDGVRLTWGTVRRKW